MKWEHGFLVILVLVVTMFVGTAIKHEVSQIWSKLDNVLHVGK